MTPSSVISGSLAATVNVQGGVLGGNGTFNGGIVVGPGGVVAPGESIGLITTNGTLAFGTGSVFGLEIDAGAGTADRVNALNITIGTGVTVNGQLIGSGAPAVGQQFTILNSTSATAVNGFFTGLGEGAQLSVGNYLFKISYQGGDGNDVVLTTLVPEPGAASMVLSGAALLLSARPRRGVLRRAQS